MLQMKKEHKTNRIETTGDDTIDSASLKEAAASSSSNCISTDDITTILVADDESLSKQDIKACSVSSTQNPESSFSSIKALQPAKTASEGSSLLALLRPEQCHRSALRLVRDNANGVDAGDNNLDSENGHWNQSLILSPVLLLPRDIDEIEDDDESESSETSLEETLTTVPGDNDDISESEETLTLDDTIHSTTSALSIRSIRTPRLPYSGTETHEELSTIASSSPLASVPCISEGDAHETVTPLSGSKVVRDYGSSFPLSSARPASPKYNQMRTLSSFVSNLPLVQSSSEDSLPSLEDFKLVTTASFASSSCFSSDDDEDTDDGADEENDVKEATVVDEIPAALATYHESDSKPIANVDYEYEEAAPCLRMHECEEDTHFLPTFDSRPESQHLTRSQSPVNEVQEKKSDTLNLRDTAQDAMSLSIATSSSTSYGIEKLSDIEHEHKMNMITSLPNQPQAQDRAVAYHENEARKGKECESSSHSSKNVLSKTFLNKIFGKKKSSLKCSTTGQNDAVSVDRSNHNNNQRNVVFGAVAVVEFNKKNAPCNTIPKDRWDSEKPIKKTFFCVKPSNRRSSLDNSFGSYCFGAGGGRGNSNHRFDETTSLSPRRPSRRNSREMENNNESCRKGFETCRRWSASDVLDEIKPLVCLSTAQHNSVDRRKCTTSMPSMPNRRGSLQQQASENNAKVSIAKDSDKNNDVPQQRQSSSLYRSVLSARRGSLDNSSLIKDERKLNATSNSFGHSKMRRRCSASFLSNFSAQQSQHYQHSFQQSTTQINEYTDSSTSDFPISQCTPPLNGKATSRGSAAFMSLFPGKRRGSLTALTTKSPLEIEIDPKLVATGAQFTSYDDGDRRRVGTGSFMPRFPRRQESLDLALQSSTVEFSESNNNAAVVRYVKDSGIKVTTETTGSPEKLHSRRGSSSFMPSFPGRRLSFEKSDKDPISSPSTKESMQRRGSTSSFMPTFPSRLGSYNSTTSTSAMNLNVHTENASRSRELSELSDRRSINSGNKKDSFSKTIALKPCCNEDTKPRSAARQGSFLGLFGPVASAHDGSNRTVATAESGNQTGVSNYSISDYEPHVISKKGAFDRSVSKTVDSTNSTNETVTGDIGMKMPARRRASLNFMFHRNFATNT